MMSHLSFLSDWSPVFHFGRIYSKIVNELFRSIYPPCLWNPEAATGGDSEHSHSTIDIFWSIQADSSASWPGLW